jgi:UDP-N-acetylmuramate: L-alanyl-gamma-D-glutamyl-meso-diaminopimelate ligase
MKIHFIAIGGSAMHNLAIALKLKGYDVSGSDDEIFEPSRSRLARYGILPPATGWFPERVHKKLEAVILGMHAREDNPELMKAQQLGLDVYSYPEFLYQQSVNKKRVVIGGSHGKTTITAMILHVLANSGIETDYMVGAQLEGFEVMVRLSDSAEWMVMEGDEYLTSPIDRRPKFLLYKPHIAVISGIAWDHINVFPVFDDYVEQFKMFAHTIEAGGLLIYYEGDEKLVEIASMYKGRKLAYGIHSHHAHEGITQLVLPDSSEREVKIFGSHNMANLNAARMVCHAMGVNDKQFYDAIGSFKGASRRLELINEQSEISTYRDFAHAPSKVKASVAAIREQYPDRRIIACLELHTFSSLSDNFIDQYRHTLKDADVAVVFYDPHAVALKRLPELNFDRIREAFDHPRLNVFNDRDQLQRFLTEQRQPGSTLLLMSSGSFNGMDLGQL